MIQEKKSQLLFKTAYTCLVCDGVVDERELTLLSQMHHKEQLFGVINLEKNLIELNAAFEKNQDEFIANFLQEIKEASLPDQWQFDLVHVAIRMLEADKEIAYQEIKFCKLLIFVLGVDKEELNKKYPQYSDYFQDDLMSRKYLQKWKVNFFNIPSLNVIEALKESIEGENNS